MTSDQAALPLPDFERLPFESLADRLGSLDADQVEQLIAYEREHGQRIAVLEVLGKRLDELQNGPQADGPTDDL